MPISFNLTQFVPWALFVAISSLAWLVVDFVWGRRRNAEHRLNRLSKPGRDERDDPTTGRKMPAAMSEFLDKATPALAKPLQSEDEKQVSKLKLRLAHAGFRATPAPSIFLAVKFALLLIAFAVAGGVFAFTMGVNKIAMMRVIMIAGTAFFLPDIVLSMLTRRRQLQIFLGLPDAIDLMVVCVEAGLGLDQAMRRVADEMKDSFPIVAYEFGLSNMHLQMGWSRTQVLRELADRNGEADLRALASALIHASRFGSSVGKALRVHSDSMRIKRHQIAEERAAKCAVKLIFPLVLFIFPGIFVVLVGPAAVAIIRTLLPTMAG